MLLTAEEIALCSFIIRTTGEIAAGGFPVARKFSMANIDEFTDAVEINKKTKATMVKDETRGVDVFKEAEIDFTTTEKALLIKSLDREFSVDDAQVCLSLKAKLS